MWSFGGDEFVTCWFIHSKLKGLKIGHLASRSLINLFYGSIVAEVENCDSCNSICSIFRVLICNILQPQGIFRKTPKPAQRGSRAILHSYSELIWFLREQRLRVSELDPPNPPIKERSVGDSDHPLICWLPPLVFASSHNGFISSAPMVLPHKGILCKSQFSSWFGISLAICVDWSHNLACFHMCWLKSQSCLLPYVKWLLVWMSWHGRHMCVLWYIKYVMMGLMY